MPTLAGTPADPHELAVERHIAAPPERVWQVMTERLAEWWCPKPWTTEIVENDWRPGGRSAMNLHGPDGETHVMDGVILEFTPGRRLVFTDAFKVGWLPAEAGMIGIFAIEAEGEGTRYRASSRHWTQAARDEHVAMGFEAGWGAVADQLAALCEGG